MKRDESDSKIYGPRGCWYRQNEGEMFCTIGLRSRRSCQISTRSGDELVMTRSLIGGTRGAAFRVSRTVARSHGSSVRIRRPCELHLFEKEKKESTGAFKFPPPRDPRQRFFDPKKCQVSLARTLSVIGIYTYTHIRNRLSFSR